MDSAEVVAMAGLMMFGLRRPRRLRRCSGCERYWVEGYRLVGFVGRRSRDGCCLEDGQIGMCCVTSINVLPVLTEAPRERSPTAEESGAYIQEALGQRGPPRRLWLHAWGPLRHARVVRKALGARLTVLVACKKMSSEETGKTD